MSGGGEESSGGRVSEWVEGVQFQSPERDIEESNSCLDTSP